ncbi:MAG: HAD hydrolase family protein, partial [Myxococcales bacterium]|nr:HAD hydrolase family protein [Myxococcales bacterium]
EALVERLRKVKLLLLDCDGVLTDGTIIVGGTGDEIKHFHVRDGHGIRMLQRIAGVKAGIVTGRKSRAVEIRAQDLKIERVHQLIWDKSALLDEILAEEGLEADEVGFIGDDVQDAKVLRRVGFAASVADGHPLAKAAAHYVTELAGGKGAVREVIDMILHAQGHWERVASGERF